MSRFGGADAESDTQSPLGLATGFAGALVGALSEVRSEDTMIQFARVRRFSVFGLAATLAVGMLLWARTADAQRSYALVHYFFGADEEFYPQAGLIQGPDGTLYGTRAVGGSGGRGTVFAVAADGSSFTTLHSFTGGPTDGGNPQASLIQGPDGTLYGTTVDGGSDNFGTVFSVAPNGNGFTILHSFIGGAADGAFPFARLIQGSDGTLYGTTVEGGSRGRGTVFSVTPNGTGFTILHSFIDALNPFAGLIQGSDGRLYGTTVNAGGTVFAVAPDGSGFTTLHSFTGGLTDGLNPYASLIQGSDGRLYGTTKAEGGPTGDGTVFAVAPDGTGFTILHSFTGGAADGLNPFAGLIQGPDGRLYGTTVDGGSDNLGAVFAVAPDGSGFTILHSFTDEAANGANPYAGLIQGPDGRLYGTTVVRGSGGRGTVFAVAPDGSGFTILHSFTGEPTDGATPVAGLIQGPDGTLYGTTRGGGSGRRGTVFAVSRAGSGFTTLHSFAGEPTDGSSPAASLIQGPDSTLYGTTVWGGSSDGTGIGGGTVFRLAPDGSGYTLVRSFSYGGPDGYGLGGLIQGPNGTLYGTATGGGTGDSGTVFAVAPDGTGFTILHNFTRGAADGVAPFASLIQGPDGRLYGTTGAGGSNNLGTVFAVAPDGTGFTILHTFTGEPTDGRRPVAGLIQGPDGTFYGTTEGGGSGGRGTVFSVSPNGTGFTILHRFIGGAADGADPEASLIQGPDGTLYGTTRSGGFGDRGTIFAIAPDGSGFAILHSFTGGAADGGDPEASLIQGPDGTLYGTASGGGVLGSGVVFRLSPGP